MGLQISFWNVTLLHSRGETQIHGEKYSLLD